VFAAAMLQQTFYGVNSYAYILL